MVGSVEDSLEPGAVDVLDPLGGRSVGLVFVVPSLHVCDRPVDHVHPLRRTLNGFAARATESVAVGDKDQRDEQKRGDEYNSARRRRKRHVEDLLDPDAPLEELANGTSRCNELSAWWDEDDEHSVVRVLRRWKIWGVFHEVGKSLDQWRVGCGVIRTRKQEVAERRTEAAVAKFIIGTGIGARRSECEDDAAVGADVAVEDCSSLVAGVGWHAEGSRVGDVVRVCGKEAVMAKS